MVLRELEFDHEMWKHLIGLKTMVKLTAAPVMGSMKSAQYPAVHRAKHISLAPFTNCG